ncbi:MAG: hypothetical protein RLZZ571_937 [Actinomycetota bacterium]|jgi:sugar (pentulose or hexulose) kinase
MRLRLWPAAKNNLNSNNLIYCGLDLGTSGLKGVLIDSTGQVVARGQASYQTNRPELGASEQNSGDWLVAISDVLSQLQKVIPASNWAGLGLSGMIPTLVCLDESLNGVGSAITWEDSRAQSFGDKFREDFGDTKIYARTGQWVDGRYLLPMWLRLKQVDPTRCANTKYLAGAKDFIFAQFTGKLITDPSTATGFGCFDLTTEKWIDELIELAGNDFALPQIQDSTFSLPVQKNIAQKLNLPLDLPITLGAADSVLGALGMGVIAKGDMAYVAGTSTVILGVVDQIQIDPAHRFLVTPMAYPGTWGIEMDLLSTGSAIRWLSGLLSYPNESAALAAAASVPKEDAPIFLPYLSPGEQGALWDQTLTGLISGLTLSDNAASIMRGLINGILLESKRCIQVLREFGCDAATLQVAGGSALDPWFRQELANSCDCEIVAPTDGDSDYSAIGAAMLCGHMELLQSNNKVKTKPSSQNGWESLLHQLDQIRKQNF